MFFIHFVCCDHADTTGPELVNDFTPCAGPPSGQVTTPQRSRALLAYSTNGLDFIRPAKSHDGLVIERAGVPDAVVLPGGRILIYYIDGCREPDTSQKERTGITVAISDRMGEPGSWVLKDVRFLNIPQEFGPGLADPNVVLLPDGKLRLFVSGFRPGPGGLISNGAYSFISTDGGFTFTFEGLRYNDILDPENYRFNDTIWQIFTGGPKGHAISIDGGNTFQSLGFFKPPPFNGVVHEIAVTEKPGEFRAYVSDTMGIKSFISVMPPWTTWTEEPGYRLRLDSTTGLESCEVAVPSVLKLGPANYLMIYLTVFPGCGCEEDPYCH